jgi:hypothetical protein
MQKSLFLALVLLGSLVLSACVAYEEPPRRHHVDPKFRAVARPQSVSPAPDINDNF